MVRSCVWVSGGGRATWPLMPTHTKHTPAPHLLGPPQTSTRGTGIGQLGRSRRRRARSGSSWGGRRKSANAICAMPARFHGQGGGIVAGGVARDRNTCNRAVAFERAPVQRRALLVVQRRAVCARSFQSSLSLSPTPTLSHDGAAKRASDPAPERRLQRRWLARRREMRDKGEQPRDRWRACGLFVGCATLACRTQAAQCACDPDVSPSAVRPTPAPRSSPTNCAPPCPRAAPPSRPHNRSRALRPTGRSCSSPATRSSPRSCRP